MTPRAAANRYGRALFDVGLKEGADLAALDRELAGVAALVRGNEGLERVLAHPAIPPAKKRAVMQQLLDRSPVAPVLAKLLLMLADRDRLVVLPDLVDAFRSRLMDHLKIVRAELTTAVEVPADRVAALRQSLASATGRQVQLETRVNPEIIGGAVTRIGSTVYDGSVTTQLQRLKKRLSAGD